MRALLLALLLPAALHPAARAQDGDDASALRRELAGLSLGDSLRQARRLYPPADKAWPATAERRTGVTRYRLEPAGAKGLPAHVETLYLGFRGKSLVEIEVVYDEERSRSQTVGKTVGDYALVYGEAKSSDDGRFWWSDRRTVLRVFNAEVPLGGHAVALRTAVQVFDRDLFDRGD